MSPWGLLVTTYLYLSGGSWGTCFLGSLRSKKHLSIELRSLIEPMPIKGIRCLRRGIVI